MAGLVHGAAAAVGRAIGRALAAIGRAIGRALGRALAAGQRVKVLAAKVLAEKRPTAHKWLYQLTEVLEGTTHR